MEELHSCEVSKQPRDDQWTCPDCGKLWLGSPENGGFLWELEENRVLRISRSQEVAELLANPPPMIDRPEVVFAFPPPEEV